jgi:hypothetical protein
MKTEKTKRPPVVKAKTPPEPATKPPVKWNGNVMEGASADQTQSENMAALATRSTTAAAFTVKAHSIVGADTQEYDIADALQQAGEEVVGGDLSRIEKMLTCQAITLDNIFNNMARRSTLQESYKGLEVFMRLGLKAQAQARSTAEALALLKNPQPYIRQANIAQGHQQVNNTYAAENSQSEPTKLLEVDHEQRMDIGTQTAPTGVNQTVATLEPVNRAKVSRR